MRLTVRTLLAWIDGLLAAADQAALGEKVQASGVAPALVERVNEVVARPSLSAPAPVGRGLADDPNTAAEFLDNALDAERLEAFERVCVESDLHLADVAGCHRLLAELSREPEAAKPCSASTSRRLLVEATKRLDPLTAAAVAVSATAAPRSGRAEPRRPQARRAPVAAWTSAAAALALLALLGGFFVWSISGTAKRGAATDVTVAPVELVRQAPPRQPDVRQSVADDVTAGTGDERAGPPVSGDAGPRDVAAEAEGRMTPEPAPATDAMPPAVTATSPPAIPPVEPVASVVPPPPPEPPAVEQRVPSGDALAIVAAPVMAEPTAPVPAPAAAAGDSSGVGQRGADTGPARVVEVGGPLLRRGEVAGEAVWMLRPADAPVEEREDLLAPTWCHPVVAVAGLTIRLEPCSRAVLTRDADGMPWLEMVFGRAVVSGMAADARLGLIAGGLRGTLSGVMRQPAGVELLLDRGPGQSTTTSRRATIFAGTAEKVWRQAEEEGKLPLAGLAAEVLVPAGAAIGWSEFDPAAATVMPPAAEPDWVRSAADGDRVARSAVQALAEALADGADTAVDEPLRRLAADRRAENRMIAAATLALLGDYRELVALLAAEGPSAVNESQWTALERMTVPLAIARGDNSAAALAEACRAVGPPGKGDLLMAIARGFNDAELVDGGAATLVDALGDGSLAVRRAAIRGLVEIVQPESRQRSTYRADRPDTLRADGIAWWRAQLEQGRIRRGGVSPPAPAAPRNRDAE